MSPNEPDRHTARPVLTAWAACAVICTLLCLTACGDAQDSAQEQPVRSAEDAPAADVRGLSLLGHLPRDPVAAWVVRMDDPASGFHDLLDLVTLLSGAGADGLAGASAEERERIVEQALGISLREDLLSHVGSELAITLDLQEIDPLVAGTLAGRADLAGALGRSGVVFLVDDEAAVERALTGAFEHLGADVSAQEAGLRVATVALPVGPRAPDGGGAAQTAEVFIGVREGRAAIGLSRPWVNRALDGRQAGDTITDGEDFSRVFAALDSRPEGLTYVNLPKVREVVQSSGMLQMALAGNRQTRELVEVFVNEESMGVGIGQTVISTGPGARTSTFGPAWTAGGPKLLGLAGATLVRNAAGALRRADPSHGRPPAPSQEGERNGP